MRVVGGVHKGRRLKGPKGGKTRPTSDATREAIFNILAHEWCLPSQGTVVLDLFAGSGAMGFEALSRGAARVTFVETDPAALRVIGENIELLGVAGQATALKVDALNLPRAKEAADLIFVDPPYRLGLVAPALRGAADKEWIGVDTVLVIELAADEQVALPNGFVASLERVYGRTRVVLAKMVVTE